MFRNTGQFGTRRQGKCSNVFCVYRIKSNKKQFSFQTDATQAHEAKKERRVAMTKSQKRRQWDRMDGKGEKARGWNWVDVVKHLSQTGGAQVAS